MGYIPAGLTLMLGPHGSGKSAFAAQLPGADPSMVVTVDDPRGRNHAHRVVESRLRAGLQTVVDDTNLGRERQAWHQLARRFGAPVTVVRFDTSQQDAHACNDAKTQPLPRHVLDAELARHKAICDTELYREGATGVLRPEQVRGLLPAGFDGTHLNGPFDVIGDVHGQHDGLNRLLAELGYREDWTHPQGRIPVLVGDIVDKGPDPVGTLEMVMTRHRQGRALMVLGNHEHHLRQTLARVAASDNPAAVLATECDKAREGRARTLTALAERTDWAETRFSEVRRWLARLPMHLRLAGGDVTVVHAAANRDLLGRDPADPKERREAEKWFLWGPTTGRRGRDGHLERVDWVDNWDGSTVVRGHVTVERPEVRNGVVSVDTGAGDGRELTAWSWPQAEFTTVTV